MTTSDLFHDRVYSATLDAVTEILTPQWSGQLPSNVAEAVIEKANQIAAGIPRSSEDIYTNLEDTYNTLQEDMRDFLTKSTPNHDAQFSDKEIKDTIAKMLYPLLALVTPRSDTNEKLNIADYFGIYGQFLRAGIDPEIVQ